MSIEQKHEEPQETKVYRQRARRSGNKKGERSLWERIRFMKQKWNLNRTGELGKIKVDKERVVSKGLKWSRSETVCAKELSGKAGRQVAQQPGKAT